MANITYWNAVGAAWDRMKLILFQPFNIEKWFVMGFAAWIAGLSSGGGGGGGGSGAHGGPNGNHLNGDRFAEFWHTYGALILTIGTIVFMIILVISLVMAWLHARGRFIFLDNLIYNRAAIVEPWKKYRKQGNSLFLWNVAIGFIGLLFILPIIAVMVLSILPMVREDAPLASGLAGLIFAALLIFIYSIVMGYLQMLVHDFVVPIMLKYDLRIREAWSRFGPVLRPAFGHFVIYGLVIFVVNLVISTAIMAAVFASCCLLLLILIIPYISTVVLLPAHVFRRWIGIEFLRQFDEHIDDIVPIPENADEIPATDLPPPPPTEA